MSSARQKCCGGKDKFPPSLMDRQAYLSIPDCCRAPGAIARCASRAGPR